MILAPAFHYSGKFLKKDKNKERKQDVFVLFFKKKK